MNRDQRWAEWNNDVIIAFEKPAKLNDTNSRDVISDGNGPVILQTFLIGCKSCQQLKPNCNCAEPEFRELLVYDRSTGLRGSLWRKYFNPGQNDHRIVAEESKQTPVKSGKAKTKAIPLSLDELAEVFAQYNHPQSINPDQEKNPDMKQFEEWIDPRLLKYLREQFDSVIVQFYYPKNCLKALDKIAASRSRIWHLRPIEHREGTKLAAGETTPTWGPQATILVPTPESSEGLDLILEKYGFEFASPNGQRGYYARASDYKLALQLYALGFNLQGTEWNSEGQRRQAYAEAAIKDLASDATC